ncbi:MAG: hypothetical protein KTR22_09715 [Flavobacteriaceae bacterium]|nr:hypothetical protein [Flavobacteriaceae bacterium]
MNRKLYYKVLFLCMLLPSISMGQETASKQIEESHPFSEGSSLLIENKYGDIYVNGWEQNTIAITVDISATDDDLGEAQALLDRIKPVIRVMGNQIVITSEIAKKEAGLFDRLLNRSKPSGKRAKSEINITVYLPNNTRAELNNKYGDILVAGWNGVLDATLEHGDLRLQDPLKESKLFIKYGKLKANFLGEAKVVANNANIDINSADDLDLESKNSEISLDEIQSLNLSSNKDEVEVENVVHMQGTIDYSNILLNEVDKRIDLDLNLAELRVITFTRKDPSVRINQDNSEVYLNILNTSFRFQANLEQGVLRIPKSMEAIESNMIDNKKKIREISATYGIEKAAVFSFSGRKGIIILKEL